MDDGWRLVSQVGSHKAFWQLSTEETDAHIPKSDRSTTPTETKSTDKKETKTATSMAV
jgi:predicted RNA binding protein YcfA (HicA-like mRNA interferase family)